MHRTRLYNIDFLRFIFAIIIVYFHVLHSNIMPYIGINEEYHILQKLSSNAYTIVECFFVISGFFLFYTCTNSHINIWDFLFKRVVRLWPVLFFSIIIGVAFFHQNKVISIINTLFLQCIGISLDYKGINWYISPLFWGSLFLYSLTKCFNNKTAVLWIAILTYFGYAININVTNGGFGRETVLGFLNLGLLRALAGLGMGYLIALASESLRTDQILTPPILPTLLLPYKDKIKIGLFTILETGCFCYLIGYFIFGLNNRNKIIVVILFTLLFLSFIFKEGLLAKVLDRPIWGNMGKYAYSIYVLQQIGFWILQRTVWQSFMVNHVFLCLLISVAFCAGLGVMTYYIVEKPCSRWGAKVKFEMRN